MKDLFNPIIKGHVKITDFDTGEVLRDQWNAVNFEAISIALARTLADYSENGQRLGYIYQMAFGNGGSSVDPTGVITYLPPNVTGVNASLYNQTYQKVVDQNVPANTDPSNNNMQVIHTSGNMYTDIVVYCLLDYGEPPGQQAFDNSTNYNGEYVFDELGLQVWNGLSQSNKPELMLITHLIFHPVEKSLNRRLQIQYTLRISALTTLTAQ